jgi:hypothetical protein
MVNVAFEDPIEIVDERHGRAIEAGQNSFHSDFCIGRSSDAKPSDQVCLLELGLEGFNPEAKVVTPLELIL